MLSKSDFAVEVGKNIYKYRKQRHLTLRKLAEKAGEYSAGYINGIENGKHSPNSYVLYRISKGLGIPISCLFEMSDSKLSTVFEDMENSGLVSHEARTMLEIMSERSLL